VYFQTFKNKEILKAIIIKNNKMHDKFFNNYFNNHDSGIYNLSFSKIELHLTDFHNFFKKITYIKKQTFNPTNSKK
jgi:hypothetical protein